MCKCSVKKKRPIEFIDTNGNQLKGMFHEWGSDVIEQTEGSDVQYTVGICEDLNGQIHEIQPSKIRFI